MTKLFRFAVQAMNLSDREAVVSAAHEAEDLGYEELYSYDHLGKVDPFIPLVIAAEATSSLRVGPLVLNNEFHHPALLARTAATVDNLTGGRLVLGLGTGYAQSEHDAMAIELRPPAERVERLAESLSALRSLLDVGSVESNGRHHHLAVTDMGVRPIQGHLPLLVGGNGYHLIQVAAQFADIFQFTGVTFGPYGPELSGFALTEVANRARWLSEAAGERDRAIERSILVQRTFVRDSMEYAVDQACAEFALPEDIVRSTPFLLLGSVAQIIDRLEQLRDTVGVSHVVIREAVEFAPVVAALKGR